MERLNSILLSGVRLVPRGQASNWSEFSILRLLDGGSIDLTWNGSYENAQCEEIGFSIIQEMEKIIEEHKINDLETIEVIKMSYEPSPYIPIDERA